MRTRFAPSPTGYLHIGGVRTALFNWLLTKRHGGQFILRIDDTDAERNRTEALQPILDGFRWLGIQWDEGPEVAGPCAPYFQSQRLDRYRAAAEQLLASGHAYPDYATKEQLAEERLQHGLQQFLREKPTATPAEIEVEKKAIVDGKRSYVYRGALRAAPPADNLRRYREQPTTLRFKIPSGRTIAVNDRIAGKVEFESDKMGDIVIVRPNGLPLYNFATVIDEIDMRISHVIRAREHLPNTPGQVLMFEALGQPIPEFAHVPVVNEPNSNKKLSKRDMKKFVTPEVRAKLHLVGWSDAAIDSRDDLNPATVAYYRELGYLPAGLVNYLGRLGWSLDDRSEYIPLEQMVANFSLDRVNDSPARFDPEKLLWLAGEYMKALPLEERVAGVLPFLQRAKLVGEVVDDTLRAKIRQIVEATGDRLKIFSDILLFAPMFLLPEPVYDPKAVEKKLKKAGAPELLSGFRQVLASVEPFAPPALEAALQSFCQQQNANKNLLIHALRVATTGSEVGVGLYESLVILGRAETCRRIDVALALCS